MKTEANPFVSVVISTRNRGSAALKTIRALLQNRDAAFEIIVVDQSDSDRTGDSLKTLKDDRLVYVRTSRTGISAGRNLGTRTAQGAVIGVTDDDCEPEEGWIKAIATTFAADERIGVVFGAVIPAPHDTAAGVIPSCRIREPFLAESLKDQLRAEGMGACMAYRRKVWEELGGFDESLGAGTAFRAGDDNDFAMRALLSGHQVYTTPLAVTVHHGFRNWKDARHLVFDYWYGTGAVYGKLIRCHHAAVVSSLVRLGWRWATRNSPVAESFAPLSVKWLRLRSFALGALAGIRAPIDRRMCLFLPRS